MLSILRELRHTLNYLYEPQILRLSPLQNLLAPNDAGRAPMPLGSYLVKAIEGLKPAAAAAGDAPAWQTYEFLYYRYVHGASQADLAKQLNCSERQVRRLQNHALAVLAEALLQRADFAAEQVVGRAPDEQPANSPANSPTNSPARKAMRPTYSSTSTTRCWPATHPAAPK